MAAYDLANFHEALRIALGDSGDTVAGYDFLPEQLNGGLRTVIRMGMVPGLALDAGNSPLKLAAPPAHPDVWGLLVAKAAIFMIGGGVLETIRTRAMTVSPDAASRRDTLNNIETIVSNIEARGNVDDPDYHGLFATADDVMTAVRFCPPPCAPPCAPLCG